MQQRFETFTILITGISRSIHRIKTEEMAEFELKSSHVSCLYYLYKADRLTASELCEICEEDKANISRALKQLEQGGYLASREKRYQSPLELTEKGREVADKIAGKIDGILQRAGEGLSDQDRAIFYKGLAQIGANLQTICEQYDA